MAGEVSGLPVPWSVAGRPPRWLCPPDGFAQRPGRQGAGVGPMRGMGPAAPHHRGNSLGTGGVVPRHPPPHPTQEGVPPGWHAGQEGIRRRRGGLGHSGSAGGGRGRTGPPRVAAGGGRVRQALPGHDGCQQRRQWRHQPHERDGLHAGGGAGRPRAVGPAAHEEVELAGGGPTATTALLPSNAHHFNVTVLEHTLGWRRHRPTSRALAITAAAQDLRE